MKPQSSGLPEAPKQGLREGPGRFAWDSNEASSKSHDRPFLFIHS